MRKSMTVFAVTYHEGYDPRGGAAQWREFDGILHLSRKGLFKSLVMARDMLNRVYDANRFGGDNNGTRYLIRGIFVRMKFNDHYSGGVERSLDGRAELEMASESFDDLEGMTGELTGLKLPRLPERLVAGRRAK